MKFGGKNGEKMAEKMLAFGILMCYNPFCVVRHGTKTIKNENTERGEHDERRDTSQLSADDY
jgi:hypothetical protein